MDKLAEMLEARQAPGVVVRRGIRTANLYDSQGRQTSIVFGGESQPEVERQLMQAAVEDGLDLKTSRLRLTEEKGQGVGPRNFGKRQVRPKKDTMVPGTPRL